MTEDPGLMKSLLNDDEHVVRNRRPRVQRAHGERVDLQNAPPRQGLQLRRPLRPKRDYGLAPRKRSPARGAAIIRAYFDKYPRHAAWRPRRSSESGNRLFETLSGRAGYIPEIHCSNFNVRIAPSARDQRAHPRAPAADIIKITMNRIDAELTDAGKMAALMILQVHDELRFCKIYGRGARRHTHHLCLKITPRSLEMKVPLKIDTKTR